MIIKGYPSQEKDDRLGSEAVTVSPVGASGHALDVRDVGTVSEAATDAVEAGSTTSVINATAHAAVKGDRIRFTSGTHSTLEVAVLEVDTNTITLAQTLSVAPSAADTFSILRPTSLTVTASGAASAGPIKFTLDGSDQEVTEDTGTPANNRPLPVKLTNVSGDITVTADNLDVQLTHAGANPDSVQLGDGTTVAGVTVSNELKVSDSTAQTSLSTLAGAVSGTEVQVDVVSAGPISTETTLSALNGKVVTYDLDSGAGTEDVPGFVLRKSASGGSVELGTASDPVRVDPTGSTTQPVSASSLPLPTGAATEATLSTLDGKVTACNTGAVTISAALPAGANNIGDVDVLSSALPTGASTSALQTTGNTSLGTIAGAVSGTEMQVDVVTSALPTGAATETTLGAVQTAVELIDDAIATDGAAEVSKSMQVAGSDGTNAQNITTDTDGHLQVDVLSGGGAGVEYTEGDTDASITGGAIMWEDAADTLRSVSAAKPLPVDVISALPAGTNNIGDVDVLSSALPTGAATSALQTTGNSSLSTVAGAVSGTEMQVDVLTSALPTGASTSALQSTGNTSLGTLAGAVSGTEMQVDLVGSIPAGTNNIGDVDVLSSALPTGAATSALQTTGNSSLTTLAGAVAGSEMQVDVVSSALPSGAATETTLGAVQTAVELIDDTVAADGVAKVAKSIQVAGSDGTLAQNLRTDTDGHLQSDILSSALPTGASTSALQSTGNTSLGTLAGAVSGTEMQVDIVAALPAGTNNIGDVDVLSSALPTGASTEATLGSVQTAVELLDDTVATDGAAKVGKSIQIAGSDATNAQNIRTDTDGHLQVDVLSSALPTGASTSALQTTGNSSLTTLAGAVAGTEMQVDVLTSALPTGASTEATLGNVKTAVELIDDAIATDGAAEVSKSMQIAGSDGTNAQNVTTDTDGHLQVDVLSGGGGGVQYTEGDTDASITGTAVMWEDAADTLRAASAAKPLPIDVISSLPAGTNNIGDVDVLSSALPTGASTSALQTTGNSSLSTLAGAVSGTEMQADIVAALPAGTNNIGDVDVLTEPATVADGGALPSVVKIVGGYDGSVAQAIATDSSGHLQVDILSGAGGATDVVDFIDTTEVLDTSSTNIAASASLPTQVVASLASAVSRLRVNDTTGKFIGVFNGAAAAEVLQAVIGPGMDGYIDVAFASTDRISVRHMSNSLIDSGELLIQFSN